MRAAPSAERTNKANVLQGLGFLICNMGVAALSGLAFTTQGREAGPGFQGATLWVARPLALMSRGLLPVARLVFLYVHPQ